MTIEHLQSVRVGDRTTREVDREAPKDDGYLGPAEVVATSSTPTRRVRVRLGEPESPGPEVDAELAFTFPYEPQVGDRLLVLASAEEQYYAVGVLAGSGPSALAFHGDVDVQAVGGALTLAADHAVEIQAPKVTVRAGVVRTLAGSVVEKAESVYRWVKGLMAVRAGESRRTVDGEDSTRCQNSVTLAKDTVKLDGDQLHLGH